jgi:hypothetical protein
MIMRRQYLVCWISRFLVGLIAGLFLPVAESSAADIDAVERGSVSGRVGVAMAPQRPKPLPVFKNRAFCGPTVPNETLLVGGGGELQNAAVILTPRGWAPSLRPSSLVLDNRQCAFVPHLQIGMVGSELLLKNSDPILHAVHARLGRDTLFNVGLPKWRQVVKRLDRAGVIRISCDVLHTWMTATIVVTATPYFAVTDHGGRFEIAALPRGHYELEVWHERLGSRKRLIEVLPGRPVNLEFIYSVNDVP